MSDFTKFSVAVNKKFNELSKNELFLLGTHDDGDRLWQAYLAAYPEGTNPIFRTRTEYDCSCCRNFVRNLGRVVAIKDGKIQTIWDIGTLPQPFQTVTEKLREFLKPLPVTSLFRTKEPRYGKEQTREVLEDKSIHTWNHFWGELEPRHISLKHSELRGEYNSMVNVFKRGLVELKADAIQTVLDMIAEKAIYRGEEHLGAIKGFAELQKKLGKQDVNLYAFENASNPFARFRNTVIGTLIQDLSEGVDIEKAVKSFEDKVAPQNYKRPTALITSKMIEQAVDKLKELGLEDAVKRRFARIEDISVKDVLFVDAGVQSKMKGGLVELLASAAKSTRDFDPKKATPISIEDFMKMKPQQIELVLDNHHRNNFVSLTAPEYPDSGQLFKWKNNFAWSYDGEVTDTMREMVTARGGRVDGVFRFTHQWNYDKRNASLMDLHVFMPSKMTDNHKDSSHDLYPSGRRIGWNCRSDSQSGGVQDVDYVEAAPKGYVPIENITFPNLAKMPEGKYVCKIHNWQLRQPTEGGFKAEIEFEGQVFQYEVDRPLKHKEWVTVAEVTLRGGKFSIEHKLPVGNAPKEKWGVMTHQPIPVETIMLSPNFWEGAGDVGNKHWFFILKGCKNPDQVRGIYNEFLNSSLEPHRKVFEVLGSKTKCEPSENQLSGVGFSSTRNDTVLALVRGRPYLIQF